jgi:hypothetical protein
MPQNSNNTSEPGSPQDSWLEGLGVDLRGVANRVTEDKKEGERAVLGAANRINEDGENVITTAGIAVKAIKQDPSNAGKAIDSAGGSIVTDVGDAANAVSNANDAVRALNDPKPLPMRARADCG